MPDFDPNEYLKKQSQSKGFDPNKYLEENTIEKKNSFQNVAPTGTQTSKRGSLPFLPQVPTKTPSVLLSDEQKQQREKQRIGERFETTLLNVPTEFGKVDQFMRSAKKVKDTLPQIPTIKPSTGGMVVIPQGEKIGDSLRKGDTLQDEFTDKLTGKKTALQKQIESAQEAFRTVQGEDVVRDIEIYQQDPEAFRFKEDNSWLGNAIKQGLLQGELANTLPQGGRVPTPEDLSLAADINYQMQRIPQSDAQKEFEEFGFGVFKNPLLGAQFLTETIASSLSALYESAKRTVPTAAATGAGLGAFFGGVGALPGAGLGMSAGLSVAGLNLSTSGDIMQSLRDSGVDITNKDALIKAFSDENKMSEIRTKALKYGVPILIFDMASAGIAGKLIGGAAGKSVARKIAAGFGEAGIQSVFGSAGELAGQVVSGKKVDWNEVALEGIASLTTDAPDVLRGALKREKASSSNKNIATQINKLGVEDGVADAKMNLDRDLANNVISPKEYQDGVEFIEKALIANDKIPAEVEGDNREQSIELIARKNDILAEVQQLNDQKEKTDDSYHTIIDEQIKAKEKEIADINSQLQQLAKPTFDTEEQLVEEIRAAEKEFNETGDSAEYQLKINDLNTRLENLVPAPKDAEIGKPEEIDTPRKVIYVQKSFPDKGNEDLTERQIGSVEKAIDAGIKAGKTGNEIYGILNALGFVPANIAGLQENLREYLNNRAEGKDNRTFQETQTQPKQDAIQVETAGQVPVLTEAPVGEEVEQGKPQPKDKVASEEGKEVVKSDGERIVYDREPTPDDGVYKILGDENNIIYRVNPNTGRIQEFSDGLWSNTPSNAIARGTARKNGFQKIKDPSSLTQEQTPAQEVKRLRAKEQAELKAAIPNADQYLTDGKVDRAKIKNAKDLKKFDEIYDKYDELITPKLKEVKAGSVVGGDVEATAKALEGVDATKLGYVKYEDAIVIEPQVDFENLPKGADEASREARSQAIREQESKPPKYNKHPIGTKAVDRFGEVYELREVPLDEAISKDEGTQRQSTVDKYVQWVKEGNQMPPAKGVENFAVEGGKIKITDGNHRYQAAKKAGLKTIPIWVALTDKNNIARPVYAKNEIAEAYHKAKADGSNPELVKAVEQSLKEAKVEEVKTVPAIPKKKNSNVVKSLSEILSGKVFYEVVKDNDLTDEQSSELAKDLAESTFFPKKQFSKKDKIENDFDYDIEIDVKPIDKPIKQGKSKTESISQIVSKDELRPNMGGIFRDAENKKLVATDGMKMVVIDDSTISKTEIIDPKTNKIIDAKYPQYDVVIPKDNPIKRKVNVKEWLSQLNGLVETKKFFDKPIAGRIKIGDLDFAFNSELMRDVFNVMAEQGVQEVELQLSQPNRALVIESNKGIMGLIMPFAVDKEYRGGLKTLHQSEPSERKTINMRTPPAVQKKEPEVKIKALSKIEAAKEGFGELETPLEKFEYQKKQISKKGKTELEINKEIFAKAKEMAAAIRGAKIDGKGKAFDATLGLPVAIWNGAIETVASAIEAGVAVADAIKRGLNYIQKNNRGQWNKKAYNDRVIAELGLRGIEVNGEDLIVQPLEDKATVELVNGFYSPLEKGIAEAKTDKATGKGWMKVLSGVTEADELNYTGVKDFLNSNADRPISRKELLDFMKNNRIEVVEIVVPEGKRAIDRFGVNLEVEGEKENYKELLVTLPSRVSGFKKKTYEKAMDLVRAIRYKELPDAQLKEIIRNEYGITEDIVKRVRESDNSPAELNDALSTIKAAEKEQLTELSSKDFKSSHFEQPNILVHLRINTRTDSEGNKVLFIEEVQSDWGQEGKKKGFAKGELDKLTDEQVIEKLGGKIKEVEGVFYASYPDGSVYDYRSRENAVKSMAKDLRKSDGVTPSAPFVTDTNAWTKLGLKTALKEAVAQGADKLAWTTGEQQNDRYNLSKTVDYIQHEDGFGGTKYVDISTPNGLITFQVDKKGKILENKNQQVPDSVGKNLADVIGKDITDRILTATKGGRLEGEGLKVGGKGMKGFYGSPTEGSLGIVGNVAKRLFGQEPKTINLETAKNNEYYIGDSPKYADGTGVEVFNNTNDVVAEFDTEAEANKFIANKSNQVQYSIDITPELKQAVKEGLPLFKNELTQAKEKVKEAKANLDKLNKNLGIASDPEQNAKALFEYHKALVGLAKAYIKAGVNSIKDFAAEIGESVTQEVKDAWNEANGKGKKTLSDFKEEAEKVQVKEEKERLRQEEERLIEIEKEKLRGEVSGIKKALVSDEIIESVNLDKISDKEMLELGKELIETGEVKPRNITLEIAKGSPRALQPKEVVALIYYKTTLDNQKRELLVERNKLVDVGEDTSDIDAQLSDIQTDIELFDITAVITAQQQSLAFRLRKNLLDKDYNLVTQIEQYKKTNKGVIPAEIEAKFREYDKQLTELKEKIKKAEEKAIVEQEGNVIENIKQDIDRTKNTKKSVLTPKEQARKKELANKYRVFNDISRVLTILAEKDFREYAKLVLKEAKGDFKQFGVEILKTIGVDAKKYLPKLYEEIGGKGQIDLESLIDKPTVVDGKLNIPADYIRDLVNDGITDINELSQKVLDEIQKDLPNATLRQVRDAITDYSKTVNPTLDEVKRQINEAKRLGRLYSQLEDIEEGKKKTKFLKKYLNIGEDEQELKRKIKAIEDSLPKTDVEIEQNETKRRELRKSYLKKFIKDREDRLLNKNFAPRTKTVKVESDSELDDLEAKANEIRNKYEEAHYENEQNNRTFLEKFYGTAIEVGTGVQRALQAGLDFSALGVQGIIQLLSTNPKHTLKAVKEGLRFMASEKYEKEFFAKLQTDPLYPVMRKSGLALQFPNSKLGSLDYQLSASTINKIWNGLMYPLKLVSPKIYERAKLFNPYRASERAYSGTINTIRVQMFKQFAKDLEQQGITPETDPKQYIIAANATNNLTFRGRLRNLEPLAKELAVVFFAPRKITATLSLTNPFYYAHLWMTSPTVAKRATLKMATFLTLATTITLVTKALREDDEEDENPDVFNPLSADFMKLKIGNTRINLLGGLDQNVVFYARFITNNYKSSGSSKTKKLGENKYVPTRWDLGMKFATNKFAPTSGLAYRKLSEGKGRMFDWESELQTGAIPIWTQGISELQQEHPTEIATFLTMLNFFGVSISTYGNADFLDSKKDEKLIDLLNNKNISFFEKVRANIEVLDSKTGETRGVTSDEFDKYKKVYGNYIKNNLKDNYNIYKEMSVEKFEEKMSKVKSMASEEAKYQITDVIPETLTLGIDNVTYKLTPDKVAERKEYIQEYIDENEDKRSFERKIEKLIEKGSIKDTPTEIKKILMSDAKEYATKKMKKEYKDNPDELGTIKD
jgi:hypothetical protein